MTHKEELKAAYLHGSNVGTYQMSGMPRKYAPLDFDSWYTEKFKEPTPHAFMTAEEVKSIDSINEAEDTFLKVNEKNPVLCEQYKTHSMKLRYLITRDYGFKAYQIQTRGKYTIGVDLGQGKDSSTVFKNAYLNEPQAGRVDSTKKHTSKGPK